MSEPYDYGPLRTFEVTWRTRPPEMVQAHRVMFGSSDIFAGPQPSPRFKIYGMFGTDWRMVLMSLEDDVTCIRDVTEQVQALERLADDGL